MSIPLTSSISHPVIEGIVVIDSHSVPNLFLYAVRLCTEREIRYLESVLQLLVSLTSSSSLLISLSCMNDTSNKVRNKNRETYLSKINQTFYWDTLSMTKYGQNMYSFFVDPLSLLVVTYTAYPNTLRSLRFTILRPETI